MIDFSFNIWAVLVATVISVIVAMVWFSDVLFGKMWRKANGITDQQAKEQRKKGMGSMAKELTWTIIAKIVFFIVLAIVLGNISASSVPIAILISILLWLGFVVPILLNPVLWEKRPIQIFWIGIFHELVNIIIGAVIIAAWM